MIKNAVYGIIAAKACGIADPSVGILNVDGARQTEKALKEVGDKISDSDRSQVQADLDKVKELVAKVKGNEASASESDIDALKAAKEQLTNSAQSVFTKMYEAAGAAAGAGQQAGPDMGGFSGAGADQGSQSQSSADDDVIDGNFREV